MNSIRLGIICFDHAHANTYTQILQSQENVTLVGFYDENTEQAEAAKRRFHIRSFSNLSKLLSEVDGVLICSDNRNHYKFSKRAIEAGVHVLVEKPITTKGDDGRELVDLSRKKQLNLMTAFPVRFYSAVQQVKQQIERGEIGEVVAISSTNYGKMPGGWFVEPGRAGGGAVLDHTVHVADIMRWMLNCEAEEIYAEADTLLHDIAVDDCGLLSIRFESGVIATLDTSWSRPAFFPKWGGVTMRIVGTKGALHLDTSAQAGNVWNEKNGQTHRHIVWERVQTQHC